MINTIENDELNKLYKKVDELVNNYIGNFSINKIEDSSDDDDNSSADKTLEQETAEKLQKTFKEYLLSDVDFFKIFILLLLAPNGLTKTDIALYLMDGKYETKIDKNGKELSPEDQIKKNVTYIEKKVAHLASLLYLFYPNERDALAIVPKRDKTRAKTIRYKFRNPDAARKMFSWLINFEGEIQSYAEITQKQRKEIAEQCIEYVLKDADSHSDIPNKNYRNNLKSIIKAIQNKTLCKLSSSYEDDDIEDDIDADFIFFLPLMIRDATAKDIDWNLFLEDRNSDQDSLFKYLKMLDTESGYVVFGLRFLDPYKGENTEWYRSAETDCISLNMIGNISLTKHNLTDKGLELSEEYKTATHPIYNLNPYRNLCGEDFYLLFPKEFYKKIPSEIRTACFNFQFDKLGSSEDKAKEWIESCGEILSQANYILMWDEEDLEGFNLTYYDKNTEYSLVKCKNYVDLLNRLNQAHILLPDSTLPRELVDRQRFRFVKSFIRKDFVASPHLVQQYEKRLNLNYYDITDAAEVYRESASDYELNRLLTYLSKFKYNHLAEMIYCQISPDIFCKAICNVDILDENNLKFTTRGIPLSVYQQGNEHYLVVWDYLNQFNSLEDKKGKELTWENSRDCIEFANEFILDSDPTTNGLMDVNAKINLELKTIPLCKIVNIQCMETTILGIRAQNNLQNYLKKELKVTTNPRIDDITKISRTYYVSFYSDEFLRSLYLPDSFSNVKAYEDINDFLYDSSNAIPDVVRSSLSLKEDEYISQNHSLSFIRFDTYKRSDVIRFLHEHMGRVFYLDTSEYQDDPFRIIEELSADCSRQTTAIPNMWESLDEF